MANGKTIKGYAEKIELNNDDAFLFQRNIMLLYVIGRFFCLRSEMTSAFFLLSVEVI